MRGRKFLKEVKKMKREERIRRILAGLPREDAHIILTTARDRRWWEREEAINRLLKAGILSREDTCGCGNCPASIILKDEQGILLILS